MMNSSDQSDSQTSSVPSSIDLSDPHKQYRIIAQILIASICFVLTAGVITALVLVLMYRQAVPWKTTSYALTHVHDDVLMELDDAALADNLVYAFAAIMGFMSIVLMIGCISASFHKRTGLKLYAGTVGVIIVCMVVGAVVFFSFTGKFEEDIKHFTQQSLYAGFTDESAGPGDHTHGATISYIWQWVQVKYECCGYDNGENYLNTTHWNRSIVVFNLSEYTWAQANMMLNLPNRVVRVNSPTQDQGRTRLIALKQILPPSCCKLDRSNPYNAGVIKSILPNNFSSLVLYDTTCPHTSTNSNTKNGCSSTFSSLLTRNMTIIAIAGAICLLLLLAAVVLSAKLVKYPTALEIERELKKKRQEANNAVAQSYSAMASGMTTTPSTGWGPTSSTVISGSPRNSRFQHGNSNFDDIGRNSTKRHPSYIDPRHPSYIDPRLRQGSAVGRGRRRRRKRGSRARRKRRRRR